MHRSQIRAPHQGQAQLLAAGYKRGTLTTETHRGTYTQTGN